LLRQGRSYEDIGDALGIPPGLAYLIATGLPADGSDVVDYDGATRREGVLVGSSQHLANPESIVPQHDLVTNMWMRSRARRDAQMQRAAESRDLRPPAIAGTTESDDITSVLGWDHARVEYLLKELEAIPSSAKGDMGDAESRMQIVDLMRSLISEHEDLEAEHFWPRVRGWLPDGDQTADDAREQEEHGAGVLAEFRGVSAATKQFDELVTKLAKALRSHVATEDTVFLRLHAAVGEDERVSAGRAAKNARRMPLASAMPAGSEAS
jgi:hypothetical protein